MNKRKRTRPIDDSEGADDLTAKAISSVLRKAGVVKPKESSSELIRKNPLILKRVAKFLVQRCFRNTVIEDYHAGYGLSGTKSKASRITQAEMKALMIEAVDKTYSFLWALLREEIGAAFLADFGTVDPVGDWNEPEFDPKFAVGLVGMMRMFAGGPSSSDNGNDTPVSKPARRKKR